MLQRHGCSSSPPERSYSRGCRRKARGAGQGAAARDGLSLWAKISKPRTASPRRPGAAAELPGKRPRAPAGLGAGKTSLPTGNGAIGRGIGGANAGNQSSTAGRSWPEGPGKVAVHLVLLLAGDGRAGLGERGPGSHPHSPRCCRQRSPPFSSLGAGSGRSVSFP